MRNGQPDHKSQKRKALAQGNKVLNEKFGELGNYLKIWVGSSSAVMGKNAWWYFSLSNKGATDTPRRNCKAAGQMDHPRTKDKQSPCDGERK